VFFFLGMVGDVYVEIQTKQKKYFELKTEATKLPIKQCLLILCQTESKRAVMLVSHEYSRDIYTDSCPSPGQSSRRGTWQFRQCLSKDEQSFFV